MPENDVSVWARTVVESREKSKYLAFIGIFCLSVFGDRTDFIEFRSANILKKMKIEGFFSATRCRQMSIKNGGYPDSHRGSRLSRNYFSMILKDF